MPAIKNLASALSTVVKTVEPKRANALTHDRAQLITQSLQDIVGEDRNIVSPFSQTNPGVGHQLVADPKSPTQGDDAFLTFMVSGSIFMDHNGQNWLIESYDGEAKVEISNVWYPRERFFTDIRAIRSAIAYWTDPVHVRVPAPPAGVDYGTQDVRIVS